MFAELQQPLYLIKWEKVNRAERFTGNDQTRLCWGHFLATKELFS